MDKNSPRRGVIQPMHRFATSVQGVAMTEFAVILPFFSVLMLASVEMTTYMMARSRALDSASGVGDLVAQRRNVADAQLRATLGASRAILGDQTGGLEMTITAALACPCNGAEADGFSDEDLDDVADDSDDVGGAHDGEPDPVGETDLGGFGDLAPEDDDDEDDDDMGADLGDDDDDGGDDEASGDVEFCFQTLWSHRFDGTDMSPGYVQESRLDFVPEELALAQDETIIISEIEYTYDPALEFILPEDLFEINERMFYRPRSTDRIDHLGSQARDEPIQCAAADD